jgi:hypothetical protein
VAAIGDRQARQRIRALEEWVAQHDREIAELSARLSRLAVTVDDIHTEISTPPAAPVLPRDPAASQKPPARTSAAADPPPVSSLLRPSPPAFSIARPWGR